MLTEEPRHRSAWTLPLVAAAIAVLVRLPFLLRGPTFFSADEAIEGLMARHLGELPVFFWGQGHKGVPEVYVAGAVFAIFGTGVLQLKCVTLAVWATAVALLVRLSEDWHGRATAIVAALLLVTGPAAVVHWSLSGTAEFVLLPAVIAALLLEYQRGIDATPPIVSPRVFLWGALAIWIHPAAACAVAALALIVVLRSERWTMAGWRGVVDVVLARDRSPAARTVALTLHGMIALTLALLVFTWFGGHLRWGPVKVASPLRQMQNGAILAVLAVLVRQTTGDAETRRRAVAAFGWSAIGFAPVIVHAVRGGSLRLTATHLSDGGGLDARLAVFRDALSGVAGLRNAGGQSLGLPWWTILGFGIAVAIAVVTTIQAMHSSHRQRSALEPKDVFPVLAAVAAAVALMGGALQDAGSSRHLSPYLVVLMVSVASAMVRVEKRSRIAAAGLLISTLLGFGWSELRRYHELRPDDSSMAILQCLEDHHQYLAHAPFQDAYPLTFLSEERIIVAPNREEDRYPPYRRAVEAAPEQVQIERTASGMEAVAGGNTLCRASRD